MPPAPESKPGAEPTKPGTAAEIKAASTAEQTLDTEVIIEVKVYKTAVSDCQYQPPVKASELGMSKTVKKHELEVVTHGSKKGEFSRPYMGNGMNLLVDQIMASGKPVMDSDLKNGLKWVVPGTCNKSKGIWELVIDLDKKEIVHFLFKGQ